MDIEAGRGGEREIKVKEKRRFLRYCKLLRRCRRSLYLRRILSCSLLWVALQL